MEFARDTKLSGEVDAWEGRASLQEDLHRLEEWANKNLIKFNKDKCNVLHMGKQNPEVQHRPRSAWRGSSSVERDLGSQWTASSVCTCAAVAKKGSGMLGCINKDINSREKETFIPLYSVLVRPHLEYRVQFWLLLCCKDLDGLEKVQRRSTKMTKGWED